MTDETKNKLKTIADQLKQVADEAGYYISISASNEYAKKTIYTHTDDYWTDDGDYSFHGYRLSELEVLREEEGK